MKPQVTVSSKTILIDSFFILQLITQEKELKIRRNRFDCKILDIMVLSFMV